MIEVINASSRDSLEARTALPSPAESVGYFERVEKEVAFRAYYLGRKRQARRFAGDRWFRAEEDFTTHHNRSND